MCLADTRFYACLSLRSQYTNHSEMLLRTISSFTQYIAVYPGLYDPLLSLTPVPFVRDFVSLVGALRVLYQSHHPLSLHDSYISCCATSSRIIPLTADVYVYVLIDRRCLTKNISHTSLVPVAIVSCVCDSSHNH